MSTPVITVMLVEDNAAYREVIRLALVRDAEGALLGLLQTRDGDPRDSDPEIGGFLWDELWTTDVQNAGAFYNEVAGLTADTVDLDADGNWTYTLDNTNATVQGISGGETLAYSFTAVSADGATQLVTITITGTNDVAVIGAGINGAGIALDAALRGLRVIVLDQDDMCSGTSAISSRLIHGGLRYLEHAELPLVFESLRERITLRRIAPHLVRPLRINIPVYAAARRGPLMIRLGMILYDLLSVGKTVPGHDMLGRAKAIEAEPGLQHVGLRAMARYYDAQVEFAERWVLEILLAARAAGAPGEAEVDRPGVVRRCRQRCRGARYAVDEQLERVERGPDRPGHADHPQFAVQLAHHLGAQRGDLGAAPQHHPANPLVDHGTDRLGHLVFHVGVLAQGALDEAVGQPALGSHTLGGQQVQVF